MSTGLTTKFAAGAKFPELIVKDRHGKQVDISKPANGCDWKMVIVFRGVHCPLCTKYLKSLPALLQRFKDAKIDVAAVSADSVEQLGKHLEALEFDDSFPIYCGMTVEQMQNLGLYVSYPRSEKETDHLFAEPGLFVIDEGKNTRLIDISNGPFARPDLEQVIFGLEWIRNNEYPIRGTYPAED